MMRRYSKVGILILAVITLIGVVSIFTGKNQVASGAKLEVADAKASVKVNKEYAYPIRNDQGQEINKLTYKIESADLRDQLVIQGQTSTAVKGRTFLIINLKVTNNYDKPININSRDYVRLSINGDENTWLAPEIHNDPVEVQAHSTKFSRLGFPISETDKKFKLRVGEIDGSKDDIVLNIQYPL